jgi:nucleoside-diphosphate-sugar epimerase
MNNHPVFKKVLVIGATGNFGTHVANQLCTDGHNVTALVRKQSQKLNSQINQQIGDATKREELNAAAKEKEVLIYGLNPTYPEWSKYAVKWLKISLAVALENGLTVVFPANVYNYDPKISSKINLNTKQVEMTKKGAIRVHMEQLIDEFCRQGGIAIRIRAGDFISKNAPNTWLDTLLSVKQNSSVKLLVPSDRNLRHNWAYLPDLATLVSSAICQSTQPKDNIKIHYEGISFNFNELEQALSQMSPSPVKSSRFPWSLVTIAGFVSPLMSELKEMRYLWQLPLEMDAENSHQWQLSYDNTPLNKIVGDLIR